MQTDFQYLELHVDVLPVFKHNSREVKGTAISLITSQAMPIIRLITAEVIKHSTKETFVCLTYICYIHYLKLKSRMGKPTKSTERNL